MCGIIMTGDNEDLPRGVGAWRGCPAAGGNLANLFLFDILWKINLVNTLFYSSVDVNIIID